MKIHEDTAAIFTAALGKAKNNFNRNELLEISKELIPSIIELEEEDFIKVATFFKRIKRHEKWEAIQGRKSTWFENQVYFYRSAKSAAIHNLRWERRTAVGKWFEDEFPEAEQVENMVSTIAEVTCVALTKINLIESVGKYEGSYGFDKKALEALKEVLA